MTIPAEWIGNFTDRFAEFLNPLPNVNTIREFMPLVPPADRTGNTYKYPLRSRISHSQTADNTNTAYAINPVRSGQQDFATLDGSDLLFREAVPYPIMLRGQNGASQSGDAAAYWQPYDFAMESAMLSADLYNELALLYGNGPGTTILSDIGELPGANFLVAGTGLNYGSATHPIVTLTTASWASGLWNPMENALVDIVNAAGTALVETDVTVEGVVNASRCQIQLFKSGSAVAVAAGHRILPKGWFAAGPIGRTCVGLQGILQNATSLFGINAALKAFWRSRTMTLASGGLTRLRLLTIAQKLFQNGLTQGAVVFVNGPSFVDLEEEVNTLRRFVDDGEVRVQNMNRIWYRTPAGPFEVRLHPYMKQGIAMVLPNNDTCVRVGASDITFRGDGGTDGFYLELANNAGYEIRCMSQQAPLIKIPYHAALITNIASSGDDVSSNAA